MLEQFEESAGVLPLNNETIQQLHLKHPDAQPCYDKMMLHGPIKNCPAVIYDELDENTIYKASLKTKGAPGPSLFNADDWRRIIGSEIYGAESVDLRKAIAVMAKQLCSEDLHDPDSIEPLMACRLIPLSKNPGVRPIGIGEVLRRIIGSAVVSTLRGDIMCSAGNLQLYGGQKSGSEIAIHAAVDLFNSEETHGIFQIDANNAFNNINRKVAVHNLKILCPEFSTYISNCYQKPARLFVTGGLETSSQEGTTQGAPAAGAVYSIAILPLLEIATTAKRIAFADDFTGIGTIEALREWWNLILEFGPLIGYFPNAKKSVLIVKQEYYEQAMTIFADTEIEITTEGSKHLGACIGNAEFKKEYVEKKVEKWRKEIQVLSKIARTHPHTAYSAFTKGVQHKYTYVMRTIPVISDLLEPLEREIRSSLIPAFLNGYICNDTERELLSLPPKFGGLGISIPTKRCDVEFQNSRKVTKEMVEKVINQNALFDPEIEQRQKKVISNLKAEKNNANKNLLARIKDSITDPERRRILEATMEPGASNWLTALPIKENGFYLEKQAFWDSLYLRYGINLRNLPTHCVCGNKFTVSHALSCPKGGFISLRHNELRDFTANLLAECHKDVRIEPELVPLTGERLSHATSITSDEARVDVGARGVWVKGQMAFLM